MRITSALQWVGQKPAAFSEAATAMTSAGGLIAFCVTVLTLLGAALGETKGYILNEPNVPFPPARPTFQNLGNICLHGPSRPRYPHNFFPSSGFSYFRRIGRTINRLESWYSLCCRGLAQDVNQILCCTEQAWKQTLSQFCKEEFSLKTVPYECCETQGDERWTCFNTHLPNPHYVGNPGYTSPEMPAEPEFSFDPTTCNQ